MNNKIGVFDSGIGGLSVLGEIRELLPNENYVYYADSKNNPYGAKSDQDLLAIVTNIVDFLISKNVKAIVIACNTVTTRLIEKLRNMYPKMIFIGTEPAIKVACDNNYKNILLLATPATVSSVKTQKIIDDNLKDEQNIFLHPDNELANAIETNNLNLANNILVNIYNKHKNDDIDCIVLGCTHYPLIKNRIQSFFKKTTIVDGNNGVARELKRKLQQNKLLSTSETRGNVDFIQSK